MLEILFYLLLVAIVFFIIFVIGRAIYAFYRYIIYGEKLEIEGAPLTHDELFFEPEFQFFSCNIFHQEDTN